MAFCSFSKDCNDNSYVTVENKFITKYLPEADGFAVKVYLYGLYLCKNSEADFTLASMAEVLKTDEETLRNAFAFWEDYDLVQIISKSPFAVQYLPVKSALGRPKKVRHEQYADFNKELQRKMQRVGKFISAGEYLKYMRFLEETSIQPPALLLIAEYCIGKKGENITPSYIFNKAKKLLAEGYSTYEQVERALSGYNENENILSSLFALFGNYQRQPDENDYSSYRKWTETLGFSQDAIFATAKKLKRGSMNALDIMLEDLYNAKIQDPTVISEYLEQRETMANLTFRIARKLGVKVENPVAYVEEYVSKWCALGFDDTSLLDIALYCLKSERNSFDLMNQTVSMLAQNEITDKESVKAYLKSRGDELKLFGKLQELCGNLRKTANHLDLLKTWKEWNFTDAMILEACKRSVSSASPMPYMNKILTDWKNAEIFDIKSIPEQSTGAGTSSTPKFSYTNPTVEAANAKADREKYYANLREKAQARAEKYLQKANANARFKELSSTLSRMEISLAKAEMFEPQKLPALQSEKATLLQERQNLLASLGISESDLTPKFHCAKCSDTGFAKNGTACDCYKK